MTRQDDGRTRRSAAPAAAATAVGLVECAVRVSPALARRIRKAAELETGGTPAAAALLAAAGVAPGRIEALETELAELRREAETRRDEAERRGVELDRSKSALKEREAELTQARRAHGAASQELAAARRELAAGDSRGSEASAAITSLRREVAAGVSLAKLDDASSGLVRTLVQRLDEGGDQRTALLTLSGYDADKIDEALAEARRPELLAASALLAQGGWRAALLKWLLGSAARP
jgi:chromosome segregation ATPase